MNLRQLEAFRAAYLTGSVSRAAEALNVSQPSVSRLISDLEASIRFKLFVRTTHGLETTPEGRRLFSSVERSFVGLAELRSTAESIRSLKGGDITLGVIPALASQIMPEAVAAMHREKPNIHFSVSVRTTQMIVDEVETNRLELGLISPIREYPNIATLYSSTVNYVCLVPVGHSLAGARKPLDLFLLTEDEFVTYDRAYLEFITSDRELLQFMQKKSHMSSHFGPVVASLARATRSIAIVDPFSAAGIVALGGVICKPIKQPIGYKIALVTRSEDALSLGARKLAAKLQEIIEKFIRDVSSTSNLSARKQQLSSLKR